MRLAIVAAPSVGADQRQHPGALDGDVMRARLVEADLAFDVVELDAARDCAEQLEEIFDARALGDDDPVLFYASCSVVLAVDGECFLCLDPEHPDTGDALRDVTEVFGDRARGAVLFVLEARHVPNPDDPFASAAVVVAVKEAVRPRATGVGVLIAARPQGGPEDAPSPLTRALLEVLDDAEPGAAVEDVYDRLQEKVLGAVPAFTLARGSKRVPLSPGVAGPLHPAPGVAGPPAAADVAAFRDEEPMLPPPPPVPTLDAPPKRTEPAPDAQDDPAPPSRKASMPPAALPETRSFQRQDPHPPRVIISQPPPAMASQPPQDLGTVTDHMAGAAALLAKGDPEGALREYKMVLGLVATGERGERAAVYVKIAEIKRAQDKRREAIASFEKALSLDASNRAALEALLELDVEERDWRSVKDAEQRLLEATPDEARRFELFVAFGDRWEGVAHDRERAREVYEKARVIRPDNLGVLEKLRALYEAAHEIELAVATRRRVAELTTDGPTRARRYFEVAQICLGELRHEDEALELFDRALESEPTLLQPLAVVARILADRQEWGELEKAYRRMLERAQRIAKGDVRTDVTWELCRRLGLLYRDHLEDPGLALDAFEDALGEKPDDLSTRMAAAAVARETGKIDRAALHLAAVARLDPAREDTFHELFEAFQRIRRPDSAYAAACVTMHRRCAEARERFVFEEHRPDGVPKLARAMRREAWELFRVEGRDRRAEAVLDAVAPAAIAARLAFLADAGKLPKLDPAARQDPEKSTVSVARSLGWACHFLAVPPPSLYVREDAPAGIAWVPAEEPSVLVGGAVTRGRSLTELAFVVGRHVAYGVDAHRLLLYYPSLEELSTCFLAAVHVALPDLPLPATLAEAATELADALSPRLRTEDLERLVSAAKQLQSSGKRADLARWAADVERCATRAGLLLSGDLDVAASVVRSDPRGLVTAEDKLADLWAFCVSDPHHALREELGVAIEP